MDTDSCDGSGRDMDRGLVALVAGATSPLGTSVARHLNQAGVSVALLARSNGPVAHRLAAELGARAMVVEADAADPGAVGSAVRSIGDRFGPIGILINAAHTGMLPAVEVANLPLADLVRQLLAVQMHANLMSAVIPGMREHGFGRIVYVAGALMARPAAGFAAFSAAKAAAAMLTRHVALEEGRRGITANIVAPGPIRNDGSDFPSGVGVELATQLLGRSALGSFPTADEISRTIGFLVRPSSGSLTGQTMWITGGEPIT